MNNLFYKKKFQLNQLEKLEPIVELFLLEIVIDETLKDALEAENYEYLSALKKRNDSILMKVV